MTARAFKNMLGQVEVLCFNCNESKINIEFSNLMAARSMNNNLQGFHSTLRIEEKTEEMTLINSNAMKIIMFLVT